MKKFANIVVSENLSFVDGGLPYIFDDQKLHIDIGDIVFIPFGQKKILTGVVIDITDTPPVNLDASKLKEILKKGKYKLQKEYIDIAKEVSEYYFAPLYNCLRLFLPSKIWKEVYTKEKKKYWKATPLSQEFSGKGKKQQAILQELHVRDLEQSELLEKSQASLTSLKGLAEKGYIEKFEKEEEPLPFQIHPQALKSLNREQNQALEMLTKEKTSLLHGVTGSGKTEVFLHFFAELLENDLENQLVLLVPEIALTTQMIEYFTEAFGKNHVAVIHSKISENEKCRIWTEVQKGNIRLIIGSRSALFMPFQKLKAIVIDEEHEWTYKSDKTPRYNTQWIAEEIQKQFSNFLILASATPDICDMYRANCQDIQLVSIKNRINNIQLPPVSIVDMRKEFARKNFSSISEELQKEIHAALQNRKQVILFLNKRGFSQALQCKSCGEIIQCPHCDVPMTHHRNKEKGKEILICHYCFLVKEIPHICPQCKSSSIHYKGTGTQKIEEEIQALFPQARILRADRDTTNSKQHFEDIYKAMKEEKADILLGTQMIAKGLDLEHVALVGVISTDTGLHIPDFRSSERVFQLLMQVAGRSGRKGKGKVIFQTFMPFHEVIQAASLHNYTSFYEQEIESRKLLKYPPFSKVIKLSYVHKEKKQCMEESEKMLQVLKEKNLQLKETNIISSAPAFIPKVHGKYHWHIIIRGENPEHILKDINLSGWRINRDPIILS